MKPTALVHIFLLVLALVLFALAGLGVPEAPRGRYIGWGLFCCVLSTLLAL
jgi:hypothetical protein